MNLDLTSKSNSKWIKGLSVKRKTAKTLEDNRRKSLGYRVGGVFFDHSKGMIYKKFDKLNIKIKNFYFVKENEKTSCRLEDT